MMCSHPALACARAHAHLIDVVPVLAFDGIVFGFPIDRLALTLFNVGVIGVGRARAAFHDEKTWKFKMIASAWRRNARWAIARGGEM